jgi:hypothetical protein
MGERLWPTLRYYSFIYLVELRRITIFQSCSPTSTTRRRANPLTMASGLSGFRSDCHLELHCEQTFGMRAVGFRFLSEGMYVFRTNYELEHVRGQNRLKTKKCMT